MAQARLSVCLLDLLVVIAYTYAALELMGLLQAVCCMFQGKTAGLSPADTENTCLKFKLTPEQVFLSRRLACLFLPKFFIILRAAK